MSVSFSSHAAETAPRYTRVEHCLCAQMAPCFSSAEGEPSTAEARELASHATPHCPVCNGTGIERRRETTLPQLGFCNSNALLVLQALELGPTLWGEVSIVSMRRRLLRALNTTGHAVRMPQVVTGRPRNRGDGVIEAPVRAFVAGLDEEGLKERLRRLQQFVEAHAAAGATTITWG